MESTRQLMVELVKLEVRHCESDKLVMQLQICL